MTPWCLRGHVMSRKHSDGADISPVGDRKWEEKENATDLLAAAVLSHRVVGPVAVDPAVAVELKAVRALVGAVKDGGRRLARDGHALTRLPGSILGTLALKRTSVICDGNHPVTHTNHSEAFSFIFSESKSSKKFNNDYTQFSMFCSKDR